MSFPYSLYELDPKPLPRVGKYLGEKAKCAILSNLEDRVDNERDRLLVFIDNFYDDGTLPWM